MKRSIYSILMILFIASAAYSQIPNTISWQGIVQDGQGNNLSGNYSITVRLFEAASGGAAVWSEVHQTVNAEEGLVNLELGSVTPFNLTFNKAFWLEVQVGTSNPMPRLKLSSVPYALYSEKSSGAIINDSLVLKDSRGVTRMVLNPNTGTFKMMNDDTVWYELSVNSPPSEVVRLPDEGRIEKFHNYFENLGAASEEKRYNASGQLTSHTTFTNGASGGETITKEYNNGELVREHGHGGSMSPNGQVFFDKSYQNGQEVREEYTKKNTWLNSPNGEVETKDIYINQNKTFTEIKYANGDRRVIKYENGESVADVLYTAGGSYAQINQGNSYFAKTSWEGWTTGLSNEASPNSSLKINTQDNGNSYQIKYSGTGTSVGSATKYGSDNLTMYGGQGGMINLLSNTAVNGNTSLLGNQYVSGTSQINGSQTINGNLNVNGTKNFRIDHPDDPKNKYLVHAAIESDQVLNQYSGNITTNENGIAIITLPDYVQKVNRNFRYQLTVIGEFAQAIVSKEISNSQFEIKTDKPNVKVSWEVTGERNDKYMHEHPFEPVQNKE